MVQNTGPFSSNVGSMLMLSAPVYRFKNIEAQVNTSCTISNLDLELLGRSELTVQCTNAFNRNQLMPRSTKYFPFSYLQLQFLCLLQRISVLQCYHLIKANHSIKICNKSVMPFYQSSHHVMYTEAQLSHQTVVKRP